MSRATETIEDLRVELEDLKRRLEEAEKLASQREYAEASRRDELEEIVRKRTSEIERQRKFLRQVIDVSPHFIFAKDREGRFTLVNQAVADAYGTSVENLIGKRDADFNPNKEEVESFLKMDLEVMDRQTSRLIPEEQITDSTGNVRWLQTIKSPLVGEDGVANQVLGSATDITARKQVEQQLRDSEAELRRSQRRLRELAGRLLRAQEDERRLLAREMHDDVTQRLAMLAIHAGELETKIDSSSNDARSLVTTIRKGLQGVSADVHDLSRQLHPAILDDLGLVDALANECLTFSEREGIEVRFESNEVPKKVPFEISICLYRIAQEALRNVAKHAQTGQARVSIAGVDGQLELTVEDQGVGFEHDGSHPHSGIGLSSMEERARLIGADLRIDSTPGGGTKLSVRVPT